MTERRKGFRLVAISMDGPETIARVRSYISRYAFTFTVLLDGETEVMQLYNPRRASPFSVLIGREGAIVWSREGYSPGDETALEELVVEMLGRQERPSDTKR
jgi:peroxiredoxin